MNLLKKMFYKEQPQIEIEKKSIITKMFEKKQSTQEVIEEIHDAFETASSRILEEAKLIIANKIPNEKAEKMLKLGFNNAKGVQENIEIKEERKEQEKIALKLEYFNNKYPLYKFITENEVEKICNKYNLVFGAAFQYKGDIPNKNIEEISNFVQPKEEDLCYQMSYGSRWKSCSKQDYKHYSGVSMHVSTRINTTFQICAPISDMNTEGYKQEGYKLVKEIPDPIVLFPVADNMYIIVSCWGLESNDELIQNPINNK